MRPENLKILFYDKIFKITLLHALLWNNTPSNIMQKNCI